MAVSFKRTAGSCSQRTQADCPCRHGRLTRCSRPSSISDGVRVQQAARHRLQAQSSIPLTLKPEHKTLMIRVGSTPVGVAKRRFHEYPHRYVSHLLWARPSKCTTSRQYGITVITRPLILDRIT